MEALPTIVARGRRAGKANDSTHRALLYTTLVTAQNRRILAAERAARVLERATRGGAIFQRVRLSRELREAASDFRAADIAEHEASVRFFAEFGTGARG